MHSVAGDYLKSQIGKSDAVNDIQFGRIDTLYQPYIDSPEGKLAKAKVDSVRELFTGTPVTIFNAPKVAAIGKELDSLDAAYKKKSETFQGKQIGWIVPVMFTKSDKDGNPVKDTLDVHLNLAGDKAVGLYKNGKDYMAQREMEFMDLR